MLRKKEVLKTVAATCTFLFAFSVINLPVLAQVVEGENLEEVIELVEGVTSEEGEDLEIDDITDEELLEAEPSELPEEEEDPELTERLFGRMLLDVEGNGEVYYLDPVTGGKEYLADGESAQLLLRRRALGINEENFSKLVVGEEKDEESVCETSALGERLKGRIVLRTEENGESYYILPTNCRAYYAGTFEASYELMKKFSLGIAKKNLAKIRDNKRQKTKNALRMSVYARADEKNVTLKEAREQLKNEVQSIRNCMTDFRANQEGQLTSEQNKERVRTCVQNSEMPRISKERREELKEGIKEMRQERKEMEKDGKKRGLVDFDVKKVFTRAKEMVKNRIEQRKENTTRLRECVDAKVGDKKVTQEQRREYNRQCTEKLTQE